MQAVRSPKPALEESCGIFSPFGAFTILGQIPPDIFLTSQVNLVVSLLLLISAKKYLMNLYVCNDIDLV